MVQTGVFGYSVDFQAEGAAPVISASAATISGTATLTAAQVLGGLVLMDPNGGAANLTLPSAASLAAALNVVSPAGKAVRVVVRNTADAAETITVLAGASGSVSGTATIAQNNTKEFLIVFDGPATYVAYSLGTKVH